MGDGDISATTIAHFVRSYMSPPRALTPSTRRLTAPIAEHITLSGLRLPLVLLMGVEAT
jgi:hypothetical protein